MKKKETDPPNKAKHLDKPKAKKVKKVKKTRREQVEEVTDLPAKPTKTKQTTLPQMGIPAPKFGGYLNNTAPRLQRQTSINFQRMRMDAQVGIVGSRCFTHRALGFAAIQSFLDFLRANKLAPLLIVSGGATGADSIAKEFAQRMMKEGKNISLREHLPSPNLPVYRRYFARNEQIVRDSTVILALWDGVSTGTLNTIEYAQKKGVPVFVFRWNEVTSLDDHEWTEIY